MPEDFFCHQDKRDRQLHVRLCLALLAIKFSVEQDLLHINCDGANWLVVGSTLLAFASVFAMLFGHGRGRFADRAVVMYRRNFRFDSGNAVNRSDEPSNAPKPRKRAF